jgi:hypothetical protein
MIRDKFWNLNCTWIDIRCCVICSLINVLYVTGRILRGASGYSQMLYDHDIVHRPLNNRDYYLAFFIYSIWLSICFLWCREVVPFCWLTLCVVLELLNEQKHKMFGKNKVSLGYWNVRFNNTAMTANTIQASIWVSIDTMMLGAMWWRFRERPKTFASEMFKHLFRERKLT